MATTHRNYKGLLQEHLQREDPTLPLPNYVTWQWGAGFVSRVSVAGASYTGRTGFARKKDAMQDAARVALASLQASENRTWPAPLRCVEQEQNAPAAARAPATGSPTLKADDDDDADDDKSLVDAPTLSPPGAAYVFVDVDHMHKEWKRLLELAKRPGFEALDLHGCAGMSSPVSEETDGARNVGLWKAWTNRANMADTMLAYQAISASKSVSNDVPFYFLSRDAAIENIVLVLKRVNALDRKIKLFTAIEPLLARLLRQ